MSMVIDCQLLMPGFGVGWGCCLLVLGWLSMFPWLLVLGCASCVSSVLGWLGWVLGWVLMFPWLLVVAFASCPGWWYSAALSSSNKVWFKIY